MEWGDKVEFLERVIAPELAAKGKKVPALEKRPVLDAETAFYLDAFSILSRGRPAGMGGPGGISYAEIDAFAKSYGIRSMTAFDRMVRLITGLDDAYLTKIQKDAAGKKTAKD